MNVNRKAAPGILIAAILAQNRKSRQSGSAPLPTLSPPLGVVLPSFLLRDAKLARYMLWPSMSSVRLLPRNSAETTYKTSPDQTDGMKLEV